MVVRTLQYLFTIFQPYSRAQTFPISISKMAEFIKDDTLLTAIINFSFEFIASLFNKIYHRQSSRSLALFWHEKNSPSEKLGKTKNNIGNPLHAVSLSVAANFHF